MLTGFTEAKSRTAGRMFGWLRPKSNRGSAKLFYFNRPRAALRLSALRFGGAGICGDLAQVGRQADGDRLERLSGNAGGRGADDGLLAIPRDDDLLETVEVEARHLAFARGSRVLESSEVNRVPRHPRPTATLRAAELRCDLRDLVSRRAGPLDESRRWPN